MTTSRMIASSTVLATMILIGLGSPGAEAQTGEIASFLQEFPRDFDRRELPRNINYTSENGNTLSGVRCATRSVGQLERKMIDAAAGDFVNAWGRSHRYGDKIIPVVFHVARSNDGAADVKRKHVKRQVRALNRAYAGSGFQFELRSIRRLVDDEFATGCNDVDVERGFKKRHAVDPVSTLNVYTCMPADVLGWSYYPWDFEDSSSMHGVVVRYSTLPKGSAAPYNLGDTLTHEVGHYLGLLHTFEGGCSGGDEVSDTPAEQVPAFGCPLPRDTCSAPGSDPVRNFMNYSDDSCMNTFTPGQAERMRDMVATFRPGL